MFLNFFKVYVYYMNFMLYLYITVTAVILFSNNKCEDNTLFIYKVNQRYNTSYKVNQRYNTKVEFIWKYS